MDINIIGFDDLLMDIDRIWAEMEPFYANIPVRNNTYVYICTFCITNFLLPFIYNFF